MLGQSTDYTVLADVLRLAGAASVPAEVHGVLCGLLCASGRQAASAWLAEQRDSLEGADDDIDAAAASMTSLEAATWAALNGPALEFELLLPDDDESLGERTFALGQWCLGFVGGLALGGWTDADAAEGPSSVIEIVKDLTAISHAGYDDADEAETEASEAAYMELVEYVRVGAQLIFETHHDGGDIGAPPMLH